ncbi:putative FAD binding protein [Thermochaetoides thermophila DSM 1495]|uniref:Putative FAD binding protein n=1 Tax=Chaetomium thermophilum (strain DSM 1495 / CBS 144.50 / IMI 039719) TaxID=759272 RepID=G0S8K4_CHATD|nr:putative FAD binding protein [Thermochaetoides thermophila DSM 1495]EGS21964.1 putative FAD binding protein [Thermochaetoides thermophila DSM 1495]
MVKTVLILGGSLAGLHVAHGLLKNKKLDGKIKVVLVSKMTHLYWNLASVRAIIDGKIKDEQIFKPIEPALTRYPEEKRELIIGTATSADFDNKTVEVKLASDGSVRTIQYDQLVLATGARAAAPDMPWKALGGYEETVNTLHTLAQRAKEASHIVVAGAGATGVELAGELGDAYGKNKTIVLLSATDSLLGGDSIAKAAERELKSLKVQIQYNARVQTVQQTTGEGGANKMELTLASGETLTTDLYLPTHGLIPNTEYIPPRYLDSENLNYRTVRVDDYLRVQETTNVWALGDIISKPRAGFFIAQKQATVVIKNLEYAILADGSKKEGKLPAVFKAPLDVFACAIGPNSGVGRAGGIKLFRGMVKMVKSKTLGMQFAEGYINGKAA